MTRRFRDRSDAGRQLGAILQPYAGRPDVLVVGLPRGGVPVAFEVAQALRAPLDALVVRKLGVPGHEELAMGAIAAGGVRVLNDEVVHDLRISTATIDAVAEAAQQELERREAAYRGTLSALDVAGRTVIVVDDGLATGATMRAAVAALRARGAARIVVAVPTAAPPTLDEFRGLADDVVGLITPEPFYAVGLWYDDFGQTSDEEITSLLERARHETRPPMI